MCLEGEWTVWNEENIYVRRGVYLCEVIINARSKQNWKEKKKKKFSKTEIFPPTGHGGDITCVHIYALLYLFVSIMSMRCTLWLHSEIFF